MNIRVRPDPKVLDEFNVFCDALAEHRADRYEHIDDLVAQGLVERVPGNAMCRLTGAGEALRAAETE